MDASSAHTTARPPAPGAGTPSLDRSLVLVGLMGAGKSSIGRRLARVLGADFADADDEIATAAGMGIPDIFAVYGEAVFRDLERRVVARLLDRPPLVLALGGGAFIDPDTRAKVKATACSVWLRADLDTLVARTARKRGARPLLAGGDPREVLDRLMRERHPVYAEADHAVETATEGPEAASWRIVALLRGGASSPEAA